MNYNEKTLLSILDELSYYDYSFNSQKIDYGALDFLNNYFSFEYFYGASKVVIIPKGADYVIKIPFDEYYDEEFEEANPLEYANDSKLHCWDYCYNELYRYHIAKKNGFGHLFAKVKLLGKINYRPIYIQEKVRTIQKTNKNYTKANENNRKKVITSLHSRNLAIGNIDLDWLCSVEKEYGTEFMVNFVKFLSENEWDDDLHFNNVGYTRSDYLPIIFDYAGFMD